MNEIHIKTLKHHLNHWKRLYEEHICEEQEGRETIEALQAAIEALQPEPCEDCVNREKVADEFASWFGYNYQNQFFYKRLKDMKSVQPERKKGKWVLIHPLQDDDGGAYACSECHSGDYGCERNKYCRWCGAEMKEKE